MSCETFGQFIVLQVFVEPPEPEPSIAVFKDGIDRVGIADELSTLAIFSIQPALAAIRGNPQGSLPVFMQGVNLVAGKCIGHLRFVAIDKHPVAIVPIEPVCRAEPHVAVIVLQDTDHRVLRQAVIY